MMRKPDLIEAVAKATGLTKTEARPIVTAVFDCMCEALRCGHDVHIQGIVSFSIFEKPARLGHNPATLEPKTWPAVRSVRAKVGKDLKNLVAGSAE